MHGGNPPREWTAQWNEGYTLLFRECSDAPSFSLDLSPYVRGAAIEALAGDGTAKLEGGMLSVEIPRKLGYLWLKIR